MPGVISYTKGDVLYHQYDLTDPNLDLDLTSDPWNLLVGQASLIRGVDVIHRGRLAPAPGRQPACSNFLDSGTGDAVDYTLTDDTKSWTPDAFIGCWLLRDSGGSQSFHLITDNDGTTITCATSIAGAGLTYWVVQEPLADLLMAESADMDGFSYNRISGCTSNTNLPGHGYTMPADNEIKKTTAPYAWDADVVGGYVYQDYDARNNADVALGIITEIKTTDNADDTIVFAPDTGNTPADLKFSVVYRVKSTKRGIWVTNGRKFWLLSGGTWTLYLDLGYTYIDTQWHVCRIAAHIVMFVSDKYPARIVKLSNEEAAHDTATTGDIDYPDYFHARLAGLLTPKKPVELETAGNNDLNLNKTWRGAKTASAGDLGTGTYRIMVRAVNVDDGAESEMVPVYDNGDLDDRDIANDGKTIAIWSTTRDANQYWPGPYHSRWTHLEVWRTECDGSAYYLERRIELPGQFNEYDGAAHWTLVDDATAACQLSDTALAGNTQATANDLLAGKPPPMCKRALSLLGVTICFGAASESKSAVVTYGVDFERHAAGMSYTHATRLLSQAGEFTNYQDDGLNYYVITSSTEGITGVYQIQSRPDANTLQLSVGPGENLTNVTGYIMRQYIIYDWPFIESDEDVWYSRTDKHAPESFQIVNSDGTSRILRVSSIGDTFRNAVKVGNYACMIMSGGVHLLYFDSGVLIADTVITSGGGTPWENSVIVYDNVVVWARPEGPRILVTSNEPDSDGHRGRLGWLEPDGKMRQWFEDAYNNGYTVDAGIDSHNGTIRFRRTVDANTFEVLEYSYLNKRWTQLDDDSGSMYVNSRFADTTESADEILYSVDANGQLFQENVTDLSHVYDSYDVQGTLEVQYSGSGTAATYTLTDLTQSWDTNELADSWLVISSTGHRIVSNTATEITVATSIGTGTKSYEVHNYLTDGTTYLYRTGAFSHLMTGDIIRFKGASESESSVARVIDTARADLITFATTSGELTIEEGVTFYIAGPRFCIRWAPMMGKIRDAIKTLRDLVVRAFTGPRNHAGGAWPDPPEGAITLSSFRDYHTTAVDAAEDEIGIFDEGNTGNLSEDRVSALEGQGSAITLQLATEDTRTDFRLEMVKAVVEEESDVRSDMSTSA